MRITYSEDASVALGIQHASVVPHAVPYLSTLSHTRTIFGKELLYIKSVF